MSYQLLNIDNDDHVGYSSRPTIQPNTIVESGGGVSNFSHGHPQGPYSRSAERSDNYGYSVPRRDKTYGNLYAPGPSYMENTDTWTPARREQLFNYPYAWDHHAPHQFEPPENPKIENFQLNPKGTTAIEDIDKLPPQNNISQDNDKTSISPYVILALYIILFIAIFYWSRASDSLIRIYLLKGSPIKTWQLFAIAIIITAFFVAGSYYMNLHKIIEFNTI